jgi:valyl-tRNA synthetase
MEMASSQDVKFSEDSIAKGRKLTIKIWNAARLLSLAGIDEIEERPQALEERWIVARLSQAQRRVEGYLAEFDFSHLVDELYRVTFDDFCDWYLEAIKPRIEAGDADAKATAAAALERLLKLLHPAMPHVTEEIWSNLPRRESRLIVAPWPVAGDESAAGALDRVKEGWSVYARSGVRPALGDEEARIFDAKERSSPVQANGNVDAERERLRKEIARSEGMLANEKFVSSAPADVVDAEREKLERYRRELDSISGD